MDSQVILKRTVAKLLTSAHVDSFWKALTVWHDKPQYANRRIFGAVILFSGKVCNMEDNHQVLTKILESKAMESSEVGDILNVIKNIGIILESQDPFVSRDNGVFITIKKLLPRNERLFKSVLELCILDTVNNEAIFLNTGLSYSVLAPPFPYSLYFGNGEFCVSVFTDNEENKSIVWLQDQLLPKLKRWAENQIQTMPAVQSLKHVSLEEYTKVYQRLKETYGRELVEIWPERTDPQKFVYEDVAIAAYLLVLWEDQRNKLGRFDWRQSFVDLGCGNGVLVYILSSEGHPGFGIDVRKRNIWDIYPQTTNLKVQMFVPSDCSLFPETDWIIGNHSDELTPWVPIIAARSSYKCNFFLLPCCAYYFSGAKYQRVDSSRSQYSEYMDYIKFICNTSGFETEIDKLNIPSTKRTCLFGMKRNYNESDFQKKCEEIIDFVREHSKEIESRERSQPQIENIDAIEEHNEENWISNFKPREEKERVRNCTQLNKDFIKAVMKLVADILLRKPYFMTVRDEDGQQRNWNAGSSVPLSEIAEQIPKEHLIELKKQCGGLQTLLKNNYQVFSVCKGNVKLTIPGGREKRLKTEKKAHRKKFTNLPFKQKPCWFYNNHPDGCPLRDEDCTFQHVAEAT